MVQGVDFSFFASANNFSCHSDLVATLPALNLNVGRLNNAFTAVFNFTWCYATDRDTPWSFIPNPAYVLSTASFYAVVMVRSAKA